MVFCRSCVSLSHSSLKRRPAERSDSMEILLQFMTIDAGPCPRWLAGDGSDCHTVHDGEY